ncbi:integrase catalytic domain-containing protein [Trichonephila clavipes]|uniref:Integrase catalytic domain-containing protein n=1 Tax=Trichonephila clavipes TaxID=2585209 RepID=A0A8X6RFV4_TRICX|nr:integrase catalytic domain-containing protein [Trichonephila clavipes]
MPQECLSNFKKARKLPSENYVQFASRLSATFDYYCQLRKVNEFRSLCDLIISDKIFETLDRDTMNHIAMKQGETYFKPQQLGRECDVYLSARGKVSNALMSRNPGSGVKTDGRNRLQTVSTWRQEGNSSNVFVAETKPNCVLCKGNNFHPLSKCYQFKKLSVEDRVEVVKWNNLCFRCFLPHRLKECRSEKNCFCLIPHNSLIHFSRDKMRNPTPTSNLNLDAPTFVPGEIEGSVEANSQSQFVVTGFEKGRLKNVFLSTVRTLVKNKYSQWVEVRCLLDVGTRSCLCTRACAEKLQLKMEKINTVVSCVNDASMVVKNCVKTSVANKAKTFESELMLLVVSKITDLIPNKVIDVDVNVSEFVPLADDKFNIPDRIYMLLGAEIFYELLKPGKFYCDNLHLVLQNTVFGYVVSGSVDHTHTQVTENRVHCGLIVDDDLNKTLKKFWEIEGVHIEPKVDTEVSLCEDHFVRTHRRNCEGRYVVSMALNKDQSCLGNSKDIAIRRLNSLWKRLSRDSGYLSLYVEFLKEYEELGHLERVVESSEPPTHYYIPHHGVLRPEKLTTKLRIVFNGSSPTTTGISLNDILLKGEVKEDVFETISRFRRHKFAFTTDIQKMYRQILINPDQQDLQRIIWKHGLDEEILTYRLKTVTYGLSNAPFLAIRTLQQLAKDEKSRFPLDSETLLCDTYMDDIMSGAPDLETAQQLQLKDALQSCGMNLHKWSSNSPELNSSLSSDVEHSFSTDIDLTVKTLGISWKPFEDCFVFKVSVSAKHIYTKREVLSVIAKLYDPLGFIGPVIAKAKVFLQQLWQCKLDWDDVLPNSIANEWREFVTTLKCIEEVKINRFIMADNNVRIVLQGFADASEAAYGVVVYLQCFLHNGAAKVSILASKSPQLVKKIHSTLRLNISDIVLHTDSTIALAWLNTPANHLKTFVANRVAKVQELTEGFQWNHVPSVLNPADLVSRGLRPCDLPNLRLWWHGPQFLEKGKLSSEETSLSPVKECEYSKELKTGSSSDIITSSVCVSTDCVSSILSTLLRKSNSYMKIVRIFSYVIRFSNNVNKRKLTLSGPLSATDIDQAETKLIRIVQEQVFLAEIKSLQSKGVVSPNSKLRNLNPFIDSDRLLRVGGWLSNSDLPYVNKHPAILPGNHNLTVQIIVHFHRKNLHTGASSLLHYVREKFWPLNGRSLCRKVVHECLVCFKSRLLVTSQLMGNLPRDRVVPDYPFNCSGVDFCGPFMIRFFSHRGKCAKLYSDNGKTFVGANKELKRFLKLIEDSDDNLAGFLSAEGIEWKFIPPRAPSFGGLWEASVKSIKYHLRRVVSGSNLTYEEFLTVCIQIEGILNSRPLCALYRAIWMT